MRRVSSDVLLVCSGGASYWRLYTVFLAAPYAENVAKDMFVTLIGTIASKPVLKSLLSICVDLLNIINY